MLKIGIECHVQLLTNSKLFCSCPTRGNEGPNTRICPTCLGYPGAKPVLNKESVYKGIKIALALNCKLPREFYFSRKNYFYNDLVNNYQRTQYEISLAGEGYMDIEARKIRIRRINLEEDPGRLVHSGKDISKASYVLIDYNRAGIPLCEIVTEPDFTTTREVRIFLQRMSIILENYLKVFDSGLEGSLRVDANISTQCARVEIKNITSFKDVEDALNYEIKRQGSNPPEIQETRGWDSEKKGTYLLRTKETEADYGFIIDTDLIKTEITQEMIDEINKEIPELAFNKVNRYIIEYKINKDDAEVIAYDPKFAELFEYCAAKVDPTLVARWLRRDLMRQLNLSKKTIEEINLDKNHVLELMILLQDKKITDNTAKEILIKLIEKSFSPKEYVEKSKLAMTSDVDMVEGICLKVIKENKNAVEDYRKGQEKAFNFLAGKVMSLTRKTADPELVRELLKRLIKK